MKAAPILVGGYAAGLDVEVAKLNTAMLAMINTISIMVDASNVHLLAKPATVRIYASPAANNRNFDRIDAIM